MSHRKRLNGHTLNGKVNGKVHGKVNGEAHGSIETGPLYAVRRSRIHGRGVFAARAIPKGTRIVEYRGRRISYGQACELYPDIEGEPTHTFLFEIGDDLVIDAAQRGNAARWINHSCAPNCEAVEEDGRIYIEAVRAIRPGEELGYDYNITLEERHTAAERRRWACRCGSVTCRGTLLASKR
jgi:hypothetical protein